MVTRDSGTTRGTEAEIARLYDRVASRYDRVGPAVFSRFGRRLVEAVGVSERDNVLDIGTGRGAILIPAAGQAIGGTVVGIDLAAAMLRETARDLARLNLANAFLVQMDARQLAFRDATFDRLLCAFTIFLVSQPEVALAEWYRVLRPGGQLGISISGGGDPRWRWYEELMVAHHKIYRFPLSPGSRGMRDAKEIETALARAGFASIQIVTDEYEFRYADRREWWEAKWTHGASYPLERMAPEVLERFKADVFSRLDSLSLPEDLREVWKLVCIVGSKPIDSTE
jgi:ubiquinone/menaquinone biosynthesis C-methylase UbiE